MGLFSKKTPASQGMIKVAVATMLTICDEIDVIQIDAVRACAYFNAYVREKANLYRARGKSIEYFDEFVWRAVCENLPHMASRFMLFSMLSFKASRILGELADEDAIVRYFEETDQEESWSIEPEYFIVWAGTMHQVIDTMLARESRCWVPDNI